ncbi:hypothetical protein [Falsiroseomonas sp.]|uniref:hypothetical protein n=1 Tax=Falsiroseomonas sp. TaxID=2870721 RepID=UPI0035635A42
MTDTYNEFEFEKEVDIKVDVDFDFDVDIELDKDVDIDIKVDSDVDLDGNFASATFSAEAIGDETVAEADVHVLVIEGELSSVDGVLMAATDSDYFW